MVEVKEGRPVLLRVGDAARVLSVSRSQAYALIQRGDLPVIRLGHSIRVNRRALEDMIEAGTSRPDLV